MKKVLEVETRTIRTLETQEIPGTPYVNYRDTQVIYLGNFEISRNVVCGFTSIENLEGTKNLDPVQESIKVPWMYNERARIIGIPKDTFQKLLGGKIHISDIQIPYTNTYDPEKYEYILYNWGSWEIADLCGTQIPLPMYFDYVEGGISDSRYNLEDLLEYLKGNPEKFSAVWYKGQEELDFTRIPYYNADEYTGYVTIEFLYYPELQELLEIRGKDSYTKKQEILDSCGVGKYREEKKERE